MNQARRSYHDGVWSWKLGKGDRLAPGTGDEIFLGHGMGCGYTSSTRSEYGWREESAVSSRSGS